jgi:hypothetical protein
MWMPWDRRNWVVGFAAPGGPEGGHPATRPVIGVPT